MDSVVRADFVWDAYIVCGKNYVEGVNFEEGEGKWGINPPKPGLLIWQFTVGFKIISRLSNDGWSWQKRTIFGERGVSSGTLLRYVHLFGKEQCGLHSTIYRTID